MNLINRLVKVKPIAWHVRWLSCWSCGNESKKLVSNLFCPSCNSLQKPVKGQNYFNIIGVDETYDVSPAELSKRYKDLQKYLHPDKFANKSQDEQEISATYSSLVNNAYFTLLEPLSRGIYMLKLRGLEISENTEVDKPFLMEIMELNEEVENAETEKQIMELNSKNRTVIDDLQKQVSKAFFEGDMKKVVALLSRLKYYTSIDTQIQAVISSKGIIQ